MANINRILCEAKISPMDVKTAKQLWRAFRVAEGWGPKAPLLTPPSANQKLDKDKRVASYGLALAQSTTSGVANTCPFSTPACRAGCVSKAGNGRYDSVAAARQLKTRFLLAYPDAFVTLVAWEIDKARAKHGKQLRVRLNTFSDIRWELVAPWLLRSGGRRYVKFYDYTKDWSRTPPANYRLTLSASELTSDAAAVAAAAVQPVAVVFSTSRAKALPAVWHGVAVVDGDKSDNRSDDGPGIIGLRAKGSMRRNPMGMVRAA